jgi:hypothetical protein
MPVPSPAPDGPTGYPVRSCFPANPISSADSMGRMRSRPLVVALLLLAGGCLDSCSENVERHYPDAAAARANLALGRDWYWIPPIVPDSATNIWEFHNIDTNRTWGCFDVQDGGVATRALLAKKNAVPRTGPISQGPRRSSSVRPWWPSSMANSPVEAHSFTEHSRFTVVVGIDPAAGKVCFHRS